MSDFNLAEFVGARKTAHLTASLERVRAIRERHAGLYMDDVLLLVGEAFHAGARAMLEGTIERDAAAERERAAQDARLEGRLAEHRARMEGFPAVKVLPWPIGPVGSGQAAVGGGLSLVERGDG